MELVRGDFCYSLDFGLLPPDHPAERRVAVFFHFSTQPLTQSGSKGGKALGSDDRLALWQIVLCWFVTPDRDNGRGNGGQPLVSSSFWRFMSTGIKLSHTVTCSFLWTCCLEVLLQQVVPGAGIKKQQAACEVFFYAPWVVFGFVGIGSYWLDLNIETYSGIQHIQANLCYLPSTKMENDPRSSF